MKRPQLERILRAASAITGADRFVIIGSQSILGQFPDSPADLLVSFEADLFSPRTPRDADLIDGRVALLNLHRDRGFRWGGPRCF